MKNNILKPLLCLSFILIINATLNAQGVMIGAKYSKNYTTLRNDEITNSETQQYKPSFGDNYGFLINYYFSENFGIQAEVLYNAINQKYEGKINLNEFKSIVEVKTVDVPLLLTIGKVFYVELGAVFSYVLDANFKETISNISKDKNDKFNSTNWAIAGGLGFNLYLTKSVIFNLGSRFNYAMDDYKGVDAIGEAIKNNKTSGYSIGVQCGLKFKL